MSRSLLSRSLEPVVAILWGVFLFWAVWTGAVWLLGIGPSWLGFSAMPDAAPPPNAALRGAVLALAENADLGLLALAAVNVHLVVASAYGLPAARRWFGIAAAGALVIGLVNQSTGLPFGWMYQTSVLGSRLYGVSVGWVLLWVVLVVGTREVVLRLRPRTGHGMVALAVGVVVALTVWNIQIVAEQHRAWWGWHDGEVRNPVSMRWWAWLSWFACPLVLAFLMREKSVTDSRMRHSVRPLIVLMVLNILALAVRVRGALA